MSAVDAAGLTGFELLTLLPRGDDTHADDSAAEFIDQWWQQCAHDGGSGSFTRRLRNASSREQRDDDCCVDGLLDRDVDLAPISTGGLSQEFIAFGCEELLDAAAGPERFLAAKAQVAELFDITESEAASLLVALDVDDGAWLDSGNGIRIRLVEQQCGDENEVATFLELSPGIQFPLHDHHINETSVLVQGACREAIGSSGLSDDEGETFGAGDVLVRAPGQLHTFIALGGRPTIFAIKSGGLSFVDG